jgi:hypothetical protein
MSPIHVKFTYNLDLISTYPDRVPLSSSTGLLNHYNLDLISTYPDRVPLSSSTWLLNHYNLDLISTYPDRVPLSSSTWLLKHYNLDLISTYPDRVPLSSSTGLLKQRTDKTEGSESYFAFYIIIIFLLSLMRYRFTQIRSWQVKKCSMYLLTSVIFF